MYTMPVAESLEDLIAELAGCIAEPQPDDRSEWLWWATENYGEYLKEIREARDRVWDLMWANDPNRPD
jgi:hypothetical protein